MGTPRSTGKTGMTLSEDNAGQCDTGLVGSSGPSGQPGTTELTCTACNRL